MSTNVVMPHQRRFEQFPIVLPVGQSSGQMQIPINYRASYIGIHNPTTAVLTIGVGQLGISPSDGMTVLPMMSYSGQMQETESITVFWTSDTPIQAPTTTVTNQAIISVSNEPIHLQATNLLQTNSNGMLQVNLSSQDPNDVSVIGTTNTPIFPAVLNEIIFNNGNPPVNIAVEEYNALSTESVTVQIQGNGDGQVSFLGTLSTTANDPTSIFEDVPLYGILVGGGNPGDLPYQMASTVNVVPTYQTIYEVNVKGFNSFKLSASTSTGAQINVLGEMMG